MRANEREVGERVSAQTDLLRQARPADARVAVLASVAELRFVYLRVAGDTVRAHARRRDIAFVMAGFALCLRVTARKAQNRMIRPDVLDFGPVGFIVAGSALGPGEGAVVRIFVAGDTVALQPEKSRGATPILAVVAILTSRRTMSAFEGPTRLAMVESLFAPAGPTHQLGVSSEMLDMTSATRLLSVLSRGVQALSPANSDAELVVTGQAGVGVESFARRVAFAAIRIAVDLGMRAGELSGREKLRPCRSRHQRPRDRGADCHQRHDQQRRGSAVHCEKIQR